MRRQKLLSEVDILLQFAETSREQWEGWFEGVVDIVSDVVEKYVPAGSREQVRQELSDRFRAKLDKVRPVEPEAPCP